MKYAADLLAAGFQIVALRDTSAEVAAAFAPILKQTGNRRTSAAGRARRDGRECQRMADQRDAQLGRRQDLHDRGAGRASPPELESNHRIERRSSLLHLRLTKYVEEVEMLDLEACWSAVEKPRRRRGRKLFLRGADDRGLLPAGLRLAAAVAHQHDFFETTAAAEAAGFRSCKRCRPTDESSASRHVAAIEKACALAAHQRNDAELGRARRRGVHQPLSLPPGVQANHRGHPARLCAQPSARPPWREARFRAADRRFDLRRGVRVELARL